MTAKEYLSELGFDNAHLPELFNDVDKSYYNIAELMEAYAAHKSSEDNKELVDALKKMVDQARKFYVMANYPAEDMPGYAFNECEKLIQKH